MSETNGPAFDHQDFDGDDCCFMCGGSGILEDSCVCNAFEDTCCCLEPEPMECPECIRHEREKQRALLKARGE